MPKYNVYMGKETGYSDVIHLIKGDKRTAIIRMAIKRRNNGVDLEGLAWKINVVNAAGQEDVYTPSAVVKDDNGIFVEWMPKGIATAAEGYTRYQLVGLGNDAAGEQMECWFAEKRISVGPSFDAQISDEQEEAASALDEMIKTVQLELPTVYAARDAANAAAKAANDSAAGADASSTKANTAAATANTAAEKANTAASKANTAASGANTAATAATAAAGTANTAASTANKAAASVNEAKDSAMAAAATANAAANSANAAAQRTETAVSNAASAASNANNAADRASAATTNANSAAANASNSSDKADASATKADNASSEAVTATQNAKDAASIATAAAMNANAAANRANEAADNVKDGVSPAASVEKTDDKVIFSVTDATGTTTVSMPNTEKVLGAVDDLKIAGKNYARNTSNSVTGTANAATGGSGGYTIADAYWRGQDVRIDAAKEYTLSFDYEFDWSGCASAMPTELAGIAVNIFRGTGSDFITNIISKDADYFTYGEGYSKGRFVITFPGSDDEANPCFALRALRSYGPDITGLKLTISNFMLEAGNEPTPWVHSLKDRIMYDPPFELIDSVSLTESVSEVIFSGFKLKSGVALFTLEPGAAATDGYVSFKPSASIPGVNGTVTNMLRTEKRYSRSAFETKGGFTYAYFSVGSNGANNASAVGGAGIFKNLGNIGYFKVNLANGTLIPAGSIVELWGIKA